jgi:hypothetical protein
LSKRSAAVLYAERDKNGKIVSLTRDKTSANAEIISAIDEEVIEFLDRSGDADHPRSLLRLSDSGLVRAIEDLIDVLIAKNVIRFTDLPVHTQKKITARRKIRERLSSDDLMVDDIL